MAGRWKWAEVKSKMTSEQKQSTCVTTTKPRRRWFQFSLTSLFLLTTLVALWLAWELSYVRERRSLDRRACGVG